MSGNHDGGCNWRAHSRKREVGQMGLTGAPTSDTRLEPRYSASQLQDKNLFESFEGSLVGCHDLQIVYTNSNSQNIGLHQRLVESGRQLPLVSLEISNNRTAVEPHSYTDSYLLEAHSQVSIMRDRQVLLVEKRTAHTPPYVNHRARCPVPLCVLLKIVQVPSVAVRPSELVAVVEERHIVGRESIFTTTDFPGLNYLL
jgi:hypothetical protein